MSLAIVHTRALLGVKAPLVRVETHLSNGLPGFSIVGLPEAAVKESRDRVRSAIINSHFEFPSQKITVNLAPADLPKEGGRYDLAIALSILAASEQVPSEPLAQSEFIGELALTGEIRSTKGVISTIRAALLANHILVIPEDNAAEAGFFGSEHIYCAENLLQVSAHLHNRQPLRSPQKIHTPNTQYPKDLDEIKGQHQARRALEVAAAGGHNILFYGPPGTGKSMLASRLSSILPSMTHDEAIEAAEVSTLASSAVNPQTLNKRPFRSPHHTASAAALVGGGSNPKPGEISLAHKGVLFLDELPEFSRHVLEVLREPLESGQIHISRANAQVEFPASFQLVAAMNPCACGYYGDAKGTCRCTPNQIERYRSKISGPLLDRIDLHIPVKPVPLEALQNNTLAENSETVRQRVETAYQKQLSRQHKPNSRLSNKELRQHCHLGELESDFYARALNKLQLSARAYDRVLRVARTIADMDDKDEIGTKHLSEALSYRNLDRQPQTAPRFDANVSYLR